MTDVLDITSQHARKITKYTVYSSFTLPQHTAVVHYVKTTCNQHFITKELGYNSSMCV